MWRPVYEEVLRTTIAEAESISPECLPGPRLRQYAKVDVIVYRHGFETISIKRCVEDALLLRLGKAAAKIRLELLDEQGKAFAAATLVADGVFDGLFEDGAVVELHAKCVGDGSLLRVVIVSGETWFLDAFDLARSASMRSSAAMESS